MAQRPVLGKGLASLLPGAAATSNTLANSQKQAAIAATLGSSAIPTEVPQPEVANRDRHPGISLASLDEIVANQFQPRRDFDETAIRELSQSIQSNGIIQPLVVRKRVEGGYQLIAGERRLRAAKMAGLKQVPIVIRRSTDREALELALVENIQRQDLNCIDEALAYFQLMEEFSLTQEEVAQKVGKERATVANYLRLLRLPEAIIDDLRQAILSFGHGKALLSVEDHEIRLRARAIIVEKRLSVRDAEALVDQLKRQAAGEFDTQKSGNPDTSSPLNSRLGAISQDLTRQWSTKVELRGNEKRGKIIIHYATRQELERLLAQMHN